MLYLHRRLLCFTPNLIKYNSIFNRPKSSQINLHDATMAKEPVRKEQPDTFSTFHLSISITQLRNLKAMLTTRGSGLDNRFQIKKAKDMSKE